MIYLNDNESWNCLTTAHIITNSELQNTENWLPD
jgi:hypothetical protein